MLLKQLGLQESGLSVLLVDDRRMGRIHGRWMADLTPTDVLSFEIGRVVKGRRRLRPPETLGDVVISAETAARRARAGVEKEVVRYLVHGVLHLTGHDHLRESERRRMNRESRRLMKTVAPFLR